MNSFDIKWTVKFDMPLTKETKLLKASNMIQIDLFINDFYEVRIIDII